MWQLTCETLHVTHKPWHVACDTWQVEEVNLGVRVWMWRCSKDLEEKGWLTKIINQSVSDGGVCWTAPATLGQPMKISWNTDHTHLPLIYKFSTVKYVKYLQTQSCRSQFFRVWMLELPQRAWPRNEEDKTGERLRKMEEEGEKERNQPLMFINLCFLFQCFKNERL